MYGFIDLCTHSISWLVRSASRSFFGATVELTGAFQQRTARGGRDVRRLALSRPDDEVKLHVRRGRHRWGAVDESDQSSEERVVRMPREAVELAALRALCRIERDQLQCLGTAAAGESSCG